MMPETNEGPPEPAQIITSVSAGLAVSGTSEDFKLRRWLVSFGSAQDWYPVGEYVALDAGSAIGRAIDVFGEANRYQAEEIPWDAVPLPGRTAFSRRKAE